MNLCIPLQVLCSTIARKVTVAFFVLATLMCLSIPTARAQSGSEFDEDEFDGMEEEMEDEDGYGYGSGAARDTILETGPTPLSMTWLLQPDWSPISQEFVNLMSSRNAADQPIMVGPVLRNESHVAFRYGNLPLALELYFGHLARGGDDAIPDLERIQFSSQLRRPAWHLHWGVSYVVLGDTAADPSPIQAGQQPMGGGFGGDGMDDEGMGFESDDFDMEEDMDLMEEEMMDEDMDMDMDMDMDEMSLRSQGPMTISVPEPEMTDPEVASRLEELMGLVATTVTEGFKQRLTSGNFGRALHDVAEEDETQGYLVGGESVLPSEQPMWIPGVTFVGEGRSESMSEAAAEAGVEFLIHFDIALKEIRGGYVQNTTRVRVINCRANKPVVASGAMDSKEVQRLLQTNRGTPEGHIADELEIFWKVIDDRLSLSPFPKLSPEVVKRRVTQVLGDNSLSSLRKLAEFRLYAHQGLLTNEELEQAFEIVGGTDAMQILYGSERQAQEAVRELARLSLASDS